MSFYPLPSPPEEPLLSSLEALVRAGLPEVTSGTAWSGDLCPSGHWLMPEKAGLHRYDVPDKIDYTPCVVLSYWKDTAPRDRHSNLYWLLHPMVELLFPRDLTASDTQHLRQMLQWVFTEDLTDPVAAGQQRAVDRLSLDPATATPGVRVLALTDTLTEAIKAETGHPLFRLSFQVLASSIAPLP